MKIFKKLDTRAWVTMALMTAISIILSRFFKIETNIIRLSFGYVPIILTGVLFGPIPGAIVAGVADFLGCILVGQACFPLLMVTPVLVGVCAGFMHKIYLNSALWKIMLASLIPNVILRIFVSSFALHALFGTEYAVLMAARIPQCIILTIVESTLIHLILKSPVMKSTMLKEHKA